MGGYYETRHTVGYEETNVAGKVYYVNYLRWQRHCRDRFLREQAPGVVRELRRGLSLITLKAECEFFSDITALDEVAVRMRLAELTQTQIQLGFDYVKVAAGRAEELAARGVHRVACMRGPNTALVPAQVPGELRRALAPYAAGPAATAPLSDAA